MARHPGSQPPPRADLGSRSSQVHWDRRVLFAKSVWKKKGLVHHVEVNNGTQCQVGTRQIRCPLRGSAAG